MSDQPDSIAFKLGELTGQLRELIHKQNNMDSKIDLIGRQVTKLEVKECERKGAINLGAWLLKTPLVGWVVGAALAVWALFKGQGQ